MDVRQLDVILVRHGEPAELAPGTFLGRTNPPLGALGTAQARTVAELVAQQVQGMPLAALWCSPLLRAQQSAEPLEDLLHLPPRLDPRLQEIDFGRWDGRVFSDIEAEEPGAAQRWFDDPVSVRPGDGESFADVAGRVDSWLEERLRERATGTLVVVAHFGLCAVLASRLLSAPLAVADRLRLHRGQAGRIHKGVLCWWGLPPQAPANRRIYGDRRE